MESVFGEGELVNKKHIQNSLNFSK